MYPLINQTQIPRGSRVLVLPEEQAQTPTSLFENYPDVLTAQQVAEVLSICDKQVREMALRGELVGFRVGKCHRFTKQSLIDFVQRGGTDGAA